MQDTEEEFLNLRLSIIDTGGGKKRKRREDLNPCTQLGGDEGKKLIAFLQLRDQMLKLDPKQGGVEKGKGLHLIHLLLVLATAVDEKKVGLAAENLSELYKCVALNGDSIQRVAAYFADGLAARLLTRRSPFYDMIMKPPTTDEEFAAFTELYRASPYYQFAHFTANQAIFEAFEEEEEHNSRSLHVIDFDVSYGFQWPSLIQSLSEKATSSSCRISLRITGYGRSLDELIETETRLASFAKGCHNLDFEFEGLLRGSKPISLCVRKKETVVVNLVLYLHTLTSAWQISETLKSVYSLNPSLVILVEQEGSRSNPSFLSRFMESLHYFAAMFDSLDDCLPPDSVERLCIEKNHFGKEIKDMVNCERGEECHLRYERLETWKDRMESIGFQGVSLSSRSLSQAKLLLKIRSHCSQLEFDGGCGGFKVVERDGGRGLSLGWQDRYLITASAWHCQ
ncbi:scarecrow-like protein 21 [Cinnamomum micranthum f. kanehirae]|uniref:Scarecrow-like protein 21 n=1 Tax=Cinnamomum micranthum f. kanehirae TaxID=337451 RepID=A0A443P442_9MAGN|nr:scarecrow-like protein 21 [Cinnamomum micranthum f. kanehirae]